MNVRRRAIIGRRRSAGRRTGDAHAAVIALANAVRGWNPSQPDASAFDPASLELEDADVAVLAKALHTFASRLEDFGERERNFTRDASHELRTPLTVIKVAADVLADEENLSNFARRSIGRIRHSVREIEALIEAFLVLARESDARKWTATATCSAPSRSSCNWTNRRASRCTRRRAFSRW